MVLFGIVGELGSGKTLSLTFLAWKNWFYRRKTVYSNYHLFKIPYIYIDTVEKLDKMKDGFFVADEFWLWIDSRTTRSNKNKIVADILLKSRKRGLTWCFTAQLLDLLDKRVRKVADFTAYPILNTAESICKVSIFRTGFPKASNYLKTFYFKTPLVFGLYDTNEEVETLGSDVPEEGEEEEAPVAVPEMKIVFQEDKETPPQIFATWAEADKYAEVWWKEHIGVVTGKI